MNNLPNHLEVLRTAKTFDDSAVGYGAKKTEIFKAFEEAYKERNEIREEIEWLLDNSEAAGKLYAAILLGKLDEEAGDEALKKLVNNQQTIEYRSDMVQTRTIGDLAEGLLTGETLIIYPPSMK